MRVFHRPVRFLNAQMMGEMYKLQVRADRSEFFVGDREKRFIAYRFPLRTGPLARLRDLEFGDTHRCKCLYGIYWIHKAFLPM